MLIVYIMEFNKYMFNTSILALLYINLVLSQNIIQLSYLKLKNFSIRSLFCYIAF